MSGNDPRGDSKKPAPSPFSIDSDRSVQLEIPSVTRLLDRRKLEIDQEVAKKTEPSTPTGAKPTIRGAARPERRSARRLEVWSNPPSSPNLGSSDALEPLTRTFHQKSGARWVVALVPKGQPHHFEARAILGGERTLWNLLTGFHWGESVSPMAYQQLVRTRSLELTASAGEADAKALRAALGLEPSLGLWLIACGPVGQSPGAILFAATPESAHILGVLEQMRSELERLPTV